MDESGVTINEEELVHKEFQAAINLLVQAVEEFIQGRYLLKTQQLRKLLP
jgi:hypothetical protein